MSKALMDIATLPTAAPADTGEGLGPAWLLGHEVSRHRWLRRMLAADGLLLAADLLRLLAVAHAGGDLGLPLGLMGLDLLAMTGFYLAVRLGLSAELEDPALTGPQVLCGLASLLLAYLLVDVGRGAGVPLVCAVLVLGMCQLPARSLLVYGGLALGLMAACALGLSLFSGNAFQGWQAGLGLSVGAAVVLPALALLARKSATLRDERVGQREALRQAVARLEALATHDALTGLTNHRHMLKLLEAECKRHARGGRAFCLAMINIDFFKRLNEEQGRECGDEILKRMASLSQAHLRASDVVARWGGEEFLILMPETDLAGSLRSLERWREHLYTRLGFYRAGKWVPVSSSAGVTSYREGETIHQTLARVEQALRSAKANGRDQVVSA